MLEGEVFEAELFNCLGRKRGLQTQVGRLRLQCSEVWAKELLPV